MNPRRCKPMRSWVYCLNYSTSLAQQWLIFLICVMKQGYAPFATHRKGKVKLIATLPGPFFRKQMPCPLGHRVFTQKLDKVFNWRRTSWTDVFSGLRPSMIALLAWQRDTFFLWRYSLGNISSFHLFCHSRNLIGQLMSRGTKYFFLDGYHLNHRHILLPCYCLRLDYIALPKSRKEIHSVSVFICFYSLLIFTYSK